MKSLIQRDYGQSNLQKGTISLHLWTLQTIQKVKTNNCSPSLTPLTSDVIKKIADSQSSKSGVWTESESRNYVQSTEQREREKIIIFLPVGICQVQAFN